MAFNRLFLAIPVPEEISSGIIGMLAPFAAIDGVRLTPVENYHVTVHFFGNIEEGETEALTREIRKTLYGQQPFVLLSDKFSLLSKSHQKMIWVDFMPGGAFAGLVAAIQQMIGEPPREQAAHITCARIKNRNLSSAEMPGLPALARFSLPVRQVELWKSVNGKDGVKYIPVSVFPLV
jgi:RNA 2',3'-cyclic 3'-phosphodiesterase